MKIDLHVHSFYSGGRLSIKEIISSAGAAGVEFLSICDNGSISSLETAQSESKPSGINYIPGVSVSAWYTPGRLALRLCAYYFNPENAGLLGLLSRLGALAEENAAVRIRALRKENVDISEERVAKFNARHFPGGKDKPVDPLAVSRFMEYCLGLDRVSASQYINSALEKQRAELPCYPAQEEVFRILKGAGAKIILAHPGYYEKRWNKNAKQIELIVQRLAEEGLDGVEAYTPANTPYQQELYASTARKRKLLVTTGSNYSGYGRDECNIGESPCPEWLAAELSARFF